jgi:hypothetical protein
MQQALDLVVDSLKKSINLTLWGYVFVIGLATAIISIVLFLLGLVIGVCGFYLFGNSLPSLILLFLLCLVFFVAFFFLTIICSALSLWVTRDFLHGKKILLIGSLKKVWSRIFSLFFAQTIVSTFFCFLLFVAVLIALLPIILAIPNLKPGFFTDPIQSSTFVANTLFPAFLLALVLLFVFLLICLLSSPIVFLIEPIVLFESIGAIDGVKKAIAVAKKNYWHNLAVIVFYFIFVIALALVFSTPDFATRVIYESIQNSSSALLVGIIFGLLSFVIWVFSMILTNSFALVLFVKYYSANAHVVEKQPSLSVEPSQRKPLARTKS